MYAARMGMLAAWVAAAIAATPFGAHAQAGAHAGQQSVTLNLAPPPTVVLPDTTNVVFWAQNPCYTERDSALAHLRHPYLADHDSAVFLVMPTGRVLRRPRVIDKDDRVVVRILTDENLVGTIKPNRVSAFGIPDSIRIVGSGISLPAPVPGLNGAMVQPTLSRCTTRDEPVYDFDVGEGQIALIAYTRQGERTLSTFSFGVQPSYTGALSLGFVHSEVRDPTYGIVVNNVGDSVLTITRGDRPTNFFAVFYTAYLVGRRNPQQLYRNPLRYINPTLGLALNDFGKNALAGLSVEIPTSGIELTVGAHAGRVHRLDPSATRHVGEKVSGGTAAIQQEEFWSIRRFVSVSLDLRAAAQFVSAAVGGGGKTKS